MATNNSPYQSDQGVKSVDGRERAEGSTRAHRVIADDLYGQIPISQWAQSLLDQEPFVRLRDVSLSDIPGALLFDAPFPSRLAHSLGVYYLARQARPRDRAAQVAALAHDLGHGPFSHLTEPLMVERLGVDHERRSAAKLRVAVSRVRGRAARLLSWLDLDEVCRLITGKYAHGREALLNGTLDYDNLDHVARFMLAAGLGQPMYDGRALARGLRLVTDPQGLPRVALADELWGAARSWQTDRAVVFQFLQSDPWNGAAHGMIRKAIDLAAHAGHISGAFFDLTDTEALNFLGECGESKALIRGVLARQPYVTIWEADIERDEAALAAIFASGARRGALEERIASEAGLRASELIATYVVSRVERPLPQRVSEVERGAPPAPRQPAAPERFVRLLAPAHLGSDYVRRARMAAERALAAFSATPRG